MLREQRFHETLRRVEARLSQPSERLRERDHSTAGRKVEHPNRARHRKAAPNSHRGAFSVVHEHQVSPHGGGQA